MPLERHVSILADQVNTVATIDVGELWDRMLGEFLAEWARLDRQGLSQAEMERELRAFMDGLSDKPVEDLARKSSTVAYNQGRSAAILSAHVAGAVQYVVRSEVLDSNTCEACEQLDGSIFEVGTSDYDQYMPPAYCLGGDRCRGFYIAIAGGGEA